MDVAMESSDLPEDYMSPRSKVAKMLADIDSASTPSPTGSSNNPATDRHVLSSALRSRAIVVDEDEDLSPTRPVGRAARRMMMNQEGPQNSRMDHDLYTATPLTTRSWIQERSHARQSSASPSRSHRGTGLFVSPTKSLTVSDDDDDDFPVNPMSSRVAQLMATKRAERLAVEKTSKRKTLRRVPDTTNSSSDLPEEIVEHRDDMPAEPELEMILSDAARPTRKASKKAMLEMERETQRLAREQALAHQIKTKKTFSTTDLFARFNFRQPNQQHSANSMSSSAPNSDGADAEIHDRVHKEPFSTPPSSPPTPWDAQKAMVDRGALTRMVPVREDSINSLSALPIDIDSDEEFPSVDDIVKQSHAAKAVARPIAPESPSRTSRPRNKFRQLPRMTADSDDELDIIQPMPAHLRAFDRVKTFSKQGEVHSKAIHALKHLAHLAHNDAPHGKRSMKPVVPPSTVNAQLIATAKAHARAAQQQRLAELQAKGVVIMSAEEQEKEAEQIESLLEKARREAQELRKKEKAAGRQNEGDEAASDDEDEDADWQDSDAEDDVEAGSEEEQLLDDAAGESASDDETSLPDEDATEEAVEEAAAETFEDHEPQPLTMNTSGKRKARIIHDEDDEQDVQPSSASNSNLKSQTVNSIDPEDPFAAFGFDKSSDGMQLMSPTAAFAATMQTPSQLTQGVLGGSASIVRQRAAWSEHLPPPPTFAQDIRDESQSQLVPSSQTCNHTQKIALDWETQAPETPIPKATSVSNEIIETPGWEPSQDAGLPSPWTAARRHELLNFAATEHETQSTVRMRISESPEVVIPKNRGRLTRGMRLVDSENEDDTAPVRKPRNAFSEMHKSRLAAMNASDRAAAEKEMKEMMDDQAEESEDEYAGLGGDDSNMIAPETEEDRAMIDESNIEINEDEARNMQKFFAERQRAAEEEATSKLFKDLTTGALRRRQGVGWELDEDEDDLAARRRQARVREEARKRKLLLQDDNVKGLLEAKGDNKGREAFLRTIGDDDDNLDHETDVGVADSQDVEEPCQDSQSGPLHEISNNKRRLDYSQSQLPPAKARRTHQDGAFSRPTSMLQVRESLSFLLDEPAQISFGPSVLDAEPDEDDEGEQESDHDDNVHAEAHRENDGGYAPDIEAVRTQEMPPPPLPTDRLPASQRRTPAKPVVVDRLTLRRGSSSSGSTGSMGWSAWSTGSGTGVKAPSLLRRATSNLSASSNANERGVTFSNGASDANARGVSVGTGARMGGNNKSSLAYQSRAQERKALGERAEKKKEENRRKIADMRRQQGGGLVDGGFTSAQWE